MFWLVVAAACVGCGVHLVGSPSARGLAITELMSVAMIAVHSTPSDPSTHDHVGSASAVSRQTRFGRHVPFDEDVDCLHRERAGPRAHSIVGEYFRVLLTGTSLLHPKARSDGHR